MIYLFSYYFFEFDNKSTMDKVTYSQNILYKYFFIHVCMYVCIYMWKQIICYFKSLLHLRHYYWKFDD